MSFQGFVAVAHMLISVVIFTQRFRNIPNDSEISMDVSCVRIVKKFPFGCVFLWSNKMVWVIKYHFERQKTPLKFTREPKNESLVQMIFLFQRER